MLSDLLFGWSPSIDCSPMNILENEGGWTLEFRAAGLEKGDIEINTESAGYLTVKSIKNQGTTRKEGDVIEFHRDRINRSIELPSCVDLESITAKLENGILKIHIKRSENKNRGNIEIL